MAREGKEGEYGSDDEEYLSIMTSAEDVSQRSLASNLVSPKKQIESELTSPSANLDKELESLLLEEARKQGIYDVDAVKIRYMHTHFNVSFLELR